MNKIKIGLIGLLLAGVVVGVTAGPDPAEAKVTLGALAVTSDGVLTLTTGTTGAGNLTVVTGTSAMVLTGSAEGTDALTLTDGDITVTDGDLTVDAGFISATETANNAVLTLVNNTITTANAMVDTSSTSITTGALVRLNANTTEADAEVLEIISAGDATSTPKGITITMPEVVSGAARGIDITMAKATTNPIGLNITMAALTTGAAISVTANAATTTTGVVRVSATGQTTGNVLLLTGGGATLASGGAVISADMGAATAGAGVEITTSGIYIGTDGVLDVNATAATTGVIADIAGTGLTSGTALKINATEATLTSGKYIDCYDAAASDFSVAKYGATVIAGNASGTDAFTLTKGDILISEGLFDMTVGDMTLADGSLTLTDADNANSITVVNNTVSTNDLADVSSTSISTGALVKLNANTIAHDGEVLEIISAGDATATPKGITVTIPDVTSGAAKGIDIVMAGATTGPIGLDITMASLTTSAAINVTANAATTTTGVVRVSATGQTTGNVLLLTGGGATLASGGAVISADMGAATAGAGVEITTSGIYIGTDGVLDVNATAATTGVIADIAGTGLTSGTALKINATEATLTSGKYIDCYDAAASDFSVAKYGATVIAGNAEGTAALTLTKGDVVVTDGDVTVTGGNIIKSVSAGVTAHVGSAQGNGAFVEDIVEIATCANIGDAVTLPTAVAGLQALVINHGANSADVFPASSDNINEAGANLAKALAADASLLCTAYDATNWECLTLAR